MQEGCLTCNEANEGRFGSALFCTSPGCNAVVFERLNAFEIKAWKDSEDYDRLYSPEDQLGQFLATYIGGYVPRNFFWDWGKSPEFLQSQSNCTIHYSPDGYLEVIALGEPETSVYIGSTSINNWLVATVAEIRQYVRQIEIPETFLDHQDFLYVPKTLENLLRHLEELDDTDAVLITGAYLGVYFRRFNRYGCSLGMFHIQDAQIGRDLVDACNAQLATSLQEVLGQFINGRSDMERAQRAWQRSTGKSPD